MNGVSLGMIALGLAIFAFGWWRYSVAVKRSEVAAGTWRQVPGTLHEASVREEETWDSDNDRVTEYHPAVRYSFQANGGEHEGSRAFLSRAKFDSERDAKAWQAKIKPGPVTVWHDPAHPSNCVLEVDRPNKAALIVGGAFAFFLIAGALLAG